jgi:hypothetical protein
MKAVVANALRFMGARQADPLAPPTPRWWRRRQATTAAAFGCDVSSLEASFSHPTGGHRRLDTET